MLTDNLFTSSRSDCDETCIKMSQLSTIPTQEFTLKADDGSFVSAYAISPPSLVTPGGMWISIDYKSIYRI